MDRETVIMLAKEAKLIVVTGAHEQGPDRDRLERFASAVAAAVKEEDARICDEMWSLRDDERARMHAGKCAAAIRASIKEGK